MLSNMPGLGDTEEQGALPSVETTPQQEMTPPQEAAAAPDPAEANHTPEAASQASTEPAPSGAAAAETPVLETPTAETPVSETPTAETPVSETPTAEMPVSEMPTAEMQDADDGSSGGDVYEETDGTPADDDAPHDDAPPAAKPTTGSAPMPPAPSGIRRGDVIEGEIVSTSPTTILVDIGAAKPGIVPARELESLGRRTIEELKPGQKIHVYVVNPRTPDGEITLSVNRAAEELDWQRAEQYRENQEPFDTKISGYNKGGLIVRFGRVRGFVPLSQLSPDRRRRATAGATPEESLGSMVNEEIVVKVMEVDRQRNRLILSERTATRESRERRKEMLIEQLRVGEIRSGRVVSIEDFGAFIDVGGAEGLVHLTELSWKHVTDPRELLSEGQEVTVEVISIDAEAKRIGLSMRRREPDPWDTVAVDFAQGQLVKGEITKLTKFGAFARLVDLPEIEGLVHISELSEKRVIHPREVVKEGDILTLRVVKVDVKNRRLGLSLKRVQSKEYLDMDWPDES